jgi:uncharacterized MAPEG superfamily protein
LVAGLLPYVWTVVTAIERGQQLGSVDNKLPRVQQARLTGRGARALGAQENAFETFPFFAAAVLVAHLAGANAGWSARLAVAYVAMRALHGICYVADIDRVRSVAFAVAQLCAAGLFYLAAKGG